MREWVEPFMTDKVPFLKKLLIKLWGYAYAFTVKAKSNTSKKENFYYAFCDEHGYYVTYPKGFDYELRCPICERKGWINWEGE